MAISIGGSEETKTVDFGPDVERFQKVQADIAELQRGNIEAQQVFQTGLFAGEGIEATPRQQALIGEAKDFALDRIRSDLEAFEEERFTQLREELAPSLGFTSRDTPILDRGALISKETVRQFGQASSALGQTEVEALINFPLAVTDVTGQLGLGLAAIGPQKVIPEGFTIETENDLTINDIVNIVDGFGKVFRSGEDTILGDVFDFFGDLFGDIFGDIFGGDEEEDEDGDGDGDGGQGDITDPPRDRVGDGTLTEQIEDARVEGERRGDSPDVINAAIDAIIREFLGRPEPSPTPDPGPEPPPPAESEPEPTLEPIPAPVILPETLPAPGDDDLEAPIIGTLPSGDDPSDLATTSTIAGAAAVVIGTVNVIRSNAAQASVGRRSYQGIIGAYGGPEQAMQSLTLSPAGIQGLEFKDGITGRTAWMSPAAVAAFDGNAGENGFILSDAGDGSSGLWHPTSGVMTGAEMQVINAQNAGNVDDLP